MRNLVKALGKGVLKAVGLDEEVEGPLEVYPPIAGGGILGVLP